jgi:Amt family ammonium transporter
LKKALLASIRIALVFGLLYCLFTPAFAQNAATPIAPAATSPSSATAAPSTSAAPVSALPAAAPAPAPKEYKVSDINNGDNAWMLMSCALVLFMTPGLAFFYAGMVRSKNVLSVLMQSFVACGLVTVQWALFGYSLAFGPDASGIGNSIIGNFHYAFLQNVSSFRPEGTIVGGTLTSYGATVPHMTYCMFQLMFAIITPALISGAIVERMKFSAYVIFMFLWATFVYDPLAHMVWSHNGWLNVHHALDFAGGSVVHMSSGFSALTLAILLGKRKISSGGTEDMRPHNLPFTLLGAALLWFGWFGFNAGSGVNGGQIATSAFVNTHVATGTAAIVWMLWDWAIYKKPTALGFASGIVAGLVAITPACGFVTPMGAFIIGILVGSVCFFAIRLKNLLNADDALDVFGVHGIGGLTGCLCTGLFSNLYINSAGRDGLFFGGKFVDTMVPQLLDAGITISVAIIGTIILAKITGLLTGGIRATDDDEVTGLDLTDHGETGYSAEGAGKSFA